MKKFKKIYVEITNICNLSCKFCPKTSRSPQFMPLDMFQSLLLQINGRAKHLYFHVMGEPLLHPELGSFLDLAAVHGYRVNITTNGTLIDSASEWLIEKPALRQVNFSLHSFEASQAKYSMDSYLDKIFEFISNSNKKNRIAICLRLWNIEDSGKKNKRYILDRLQKEFAVDNAVLDNQITSVMGFKLKENVFLNKASRFDWPKIGGEDIGAQGSCYGLRDQLAILVDGSVVPCCLDAEGSMNLGNIREETLEEILNKPRAKAISSGFSQGRVVEQLCKKCSYRNRFDKASTNRQSTAAIMSSRGETPPRIP